VTDDEKMEAIWQAALKRAESISKASLTGTREEMLTRELALLLAASAMHFALTLTSGAPSGGGYESFCTLLDTVKKDYLECAASLGARDKIQ
jgi:hypothetical protein